MASVVGREFELELLEALLDEPTTSLDALEEATDGRPGARGRRARPLRLRPRARARDALRAPEHDAAACGCTAGSARRWRPRGDANPAELAHHFYESRRARRPSTTRSPPPSRPRPRSPTRRRPSTTGARGDDRRRRAARARRRRAARRRPRRRARRSPRRRARPRAGDREALAEAALGFAGRHAEAGVIDREGIALLEEALAALRRRPRARRPAARAAGRPPALRRRSADRALALSAEALAMAHRLGDPRALLVALESRHAALLHVDHLDERLRAERGAAGARRRGSASASWRRSATTGASTTCSRPAASTTRAPSTAALATLAAELRQPLYHHFARRLGGRVGADGGPRRRRRAARPRGLRARPRAPRPATPRRSTPPRLLILRRREDALQDFVGTIEGYVERNPALVAWRAILPMAHLLGGDTQAGVAQFRAARAGRVRRDPARHVLVHRDRAARRDVRADRRRRAGAPVLYRAARAAPRASSCRSPRPRASARRIASSRCWRRAGRLRRAPSATSRPALESNARCGLRPVVALMRREYAEMLIARGDDGDRARAALLARDAARGRGGRDVAADQPRANATRRASDICMR